MIYAAVGTFDGVHLGHRALVKQVIECAEKNNAISAIFTFSHHPLEIVAPEKAPHILTPTAEKIDLLHQCGAVKVIMLDFDEKLRNLSALDFMKLLRDKYDVGGLVIGFNHKFGRGREGDFDSYHHIGEELGFEVTKGRKEILEISPHEIIPVSSSAIRDAISHRQLSNGNAMLGRAYSIDGTVGHGQGIGRTIGWPTANVVPIDSRQLIPSHGVYSGWGILESGEKYPAMINIGKRPTIAQGLESTIEANLIGFEGDLYDKKLKLEFSKYLREERKFGSLDELCAQLREDARIALDHSQNQL